MMTSTTADINAPQAGRSRAVCSNQPGVHPRLGETVRRHLASTYRRPVSRHAAEAWPAVAAALAEHPRPLVLDSFCGTGRSTALLAARHPGHLVVGVDRSAYRLARHVATGQENYLLLRADVEDIWQLLLDAGLRLDYHYLLYPNPWPKGKHLKRRVHGHPAFTRLLALAGTVELRSNWRLYVEEFGIAMHLAGRTGAVAQLEGDPPLTLFEEKYRRSGHALWRYRSRAAVTNPAE